MMDSLSHLDHSLNNISIILPSAENIMESQAHHHPAMFPPQQQFGQRLNNNYHPPPCFCPDHTSQRPPCPPVSTSFGRPAPPPVSLSGQPFIGSGSIYQHPIPTYPNGMYQREVHHHPFSSTGPPPVNYHQRISHFSVCHNSAFALPPTPYPLAPPPPPPGAQVNQPVTTTVNQQAPRVDLGLPGGSSGPLFQVQSPRLADIMGPEDPLLSATPVNERSEGNDDIRSEPGPQNESPRIRTYSKAQAQSPSSIKTPSQGNKEKTPEEYEREIEVLTKRNEELKSQVAFLRKKIDQLVQRKSQEALSHSPQPDDLQDAAADSTCNQVGQLKIRNKTLANQLKHARTAISKANKKIDDLQSSNANIIRRLIEASVHPEMRDVGSECDLIQADPMYRSINGAIYRNDPGTCSFIMKQNFPSSMS